MPLVLGLNAYHGDASACLVEDGKVICAAEEERFLRIKHWAGFPTNAIKFCLQERGCTLSDLESIGINSNPRANYLRKVAHVLRYRASVSLVAERLANATARSSLEQQLSDAFPSENFRGKIHRVEHHLAHLASAFYPSGFQNSAVLSVDGFGDFASGAWGLGSHLGIEVRDRVFYPHSLGAFYQAITQFIGFPNYGDEYKVMGLAPYGKPKYLSEMQKIVKLANAGKYELDLDYFVFHREKVAYEWNDTSPSVGTLYSEKLHSLLGDSRQTNEELTQRHMDIACSAQAMFEEALFHMLEFIQQRSASDNLCLAGGCGNNSVANGKIRNNTDFKSVYVAAASGDAGGAIGAALVAHNLENSNPTAITKPMKHAYVGPAYSDVEVEEALNEQTEKLEAENIGVAKLEDWDELIRKTAERISNGEVIGWFQGKMEWGPRALGNRSILGDPRNQRMKEILNVKIKRRESFRPFAPSILREEVANWFEQDDDVPFMMKVFQIKPSRRKDIPAVTHVDGSGRLQTVYDDTNPKYYSLIKEFGEQTGVPILLNTSFNENEPVVCKPSEALDCFLRTKMDVLVINNYFIARN